MGKATIVTHLGGARYSVVIHQDRTRLDEMIQAAGDMLELLQPEFDQAQADYDQAVADYQQTLADRDDDIDLALPGVPVPESLARSINEKTNEISAWFDTVARAQFKLNNIKARILNLEKRIEWLQSLYDEDQLPKTAYCIDMSDGDTEDGGDPRPLLSGDVATVEPFRRGDEIRLINGGTPQYRADPTYVEADDGVIVPVSCMTPSQYLYNYAMWSGAEAWRARFHVARIVSKSTPSGPVDVELQLGSHLSQDGFTTTLTGVPVQYMDCDGKAFLVGDFVIITYDTGNTNPKVVGFAQAPRACPLPKDFLIHATAEGTYWRLTFDDALQTWSKTQVGKIAGPHVWYARNRVVSCDFHGKAVYMNGTAYSTAGIGSLGMKPIHACYNSRGNLAALLVPIVNSNSLHYAQVWERIGTTWTFVVNIEGKTLQASDYYPDKEWGWFRFRLWSPDGDQLLDPESGYIHRIDWDAKTATAVQGTQVVNDRSGQAPSRWSTTTAYTAKTFSGTFAEKNANYSTDKSSFSLVDCYYWGPAGDVVQVGGNYTYNLDGKENWSADFIPQSCQNNGDEEAFQYLDYYENSQIIGDLDLGGFTVSGLHDYHLERKRLGNLQRYTTADCSNQQVDPYPQLNYSEDWTSFLYAGAFVKSFPYANAYLCITQDMKAYYDSVYPGPPTSEYNNLENLISSFPWSLKGLGVNDDDRRWRLFRSRYSAADKVVKYAVIYNQTIVDTGGVIPAPVVESDANYGTNLFHNVSRDNEWTAKNSGAETGQQVDNVLYLIKNGDWTASIFGTSRLYNLTPMDEVHSQFASVRHLNWYGQYQGSPSDYCEIAADLYGNACAINNQANKDGSRIRYLSNGNLDTLFAGFDLNGLRLVGMI